MRRVGIHPDSRLCHYGHDLSDINVGKPYGMCTGQERNRLIIMADCQ
jgi:hypothetical protein